MLQDSNSVVSSQHNIVEINFLKSHVTHLTFSNSRSKANSSTKISVWNLTHGDGNLKSVSDRELDRETDLQNAPPHPLLKASESESTLRDPNLSIVQGVESETCRKTGNRIIPERETLDCSMCYRRKTPHTPVFEIQDNKSLSFWKAFTKWGEVRTNNLDQRKEKPLQPRRCLFQRQKQCKSVKTEGKKKKHTHTHTHLHTSTRFNGMDLQKQHDDAHQVRHISS